MGFTQADRVENIRRIAEVSALFLDAGLIVLVSVISPYQAERQMARRRWPTGWLPACWAETQATRAGVGFTDAVGDKPKTHRVLSYPVGSPDGSVGSTDATRVKTRVVPWGLPTQNY